ncbi:BSD domain [Sesbania bispinosa]|nr:BSD domain [Sesbania bispinosa]
MQLWNKARSFAEETAKRSQDLSLGAYKLSDIIAETTKEIAAQASKHLAEKKETEKDKDVNIDLESFGITDELREFVKGITITTFQDFPLQDDTELFDVPAVSNVRQDLTEWQETHANLVLSTVKEISRLRYELCPRVMKERKFWRIYFILLNSHIAPYENRYMEDAKLKSSEQVKDNIVMEPLEVELNSIQEVQQVKKETKTSNSSTEQDLDAFLLGDTRNSDDDPDDGDGGFDDDLDKLVDSSDDEKRK